jgi:hypothetical protein
MVARVAEGVERHDEVHHRREDRPEAVAVAGVFEDPLLRLADGRLADHLRPAALPHLQRHVELTEERGEAVALRELEALARHLQLLEGEAVRHRPSVGLGLDDRERHHDRARPRRHLVHQTARHQRQLHRDGGHVAAGVEPEQAQVDPDVAVGFLDAA